MSPKTAFVLGGGGILGATQVGMLKALVDREIRPDLIAGASVGALNGAVVAADPGPACVDTLTRVWSTLAEQGVFSDSLVTQAMRVAKYRTHLHSMAPLRRLLERTVPVPDIEDLAVPFQCVAASIERATAHWFTTGPIAPAVAASCSVPGLFPPTVIDGQHYLDGGLVHSIPVGRAVSLGATRIFVLHVGRIEQPLHPPRWPWEVGVVAFEIARRHRFVEEMAQLDGGVEVHVLPSGGSASPSVNMRYRNPGQVARPIDTAYRASIEYLDARS